MLNGWVLTWTDVAAADLTPTQLHDVLRLRNLVFIVEQDCAYDDVDGLDLQPSTRHLLVTAAGALAACSRFLPVDDAVWVGRIVVARAHRGTGLGRELVRRSLALCAERWPGLPVRIAAQAHLEGFYAEAGFQVIGTPYVLDDIPHVDMQLR